MGISSSIDNFGMCIEFEIVSSHYQLQRIMQAVTSSFWIGVDVQNLKEVKVSIFSWYSLNDHAGPPSCNVQDWIGDEWLIDYKHHPISS